MKRISGAVLMALTMLLCATNAWAVPPVKLYGLNMTYTEVGVDRHAGVARYSLQFGGQVKHPVIYGAIESVHPEGGWNAVAYGTQTLVDCKNGLHLREDQYFTACMVKVKMEKPGTWEGAVAGEWSGIKVSVGYVPGSGRQYIFFEYYMEIFRFAESHFSVCRAQQRCFDVSV